MLNQNFCEQLEYEICKAFKNSDQEVLKGLWCDGVLPSGSEIKYSQKYIYDNKKTLLKAFIGKDGQTEFELLLKFGVKALSRYVGNLDIRECIPDTNEKNWIIIDVENKKIEI